MTPDQLVAATGCTPAVAAVWAPALTHGCDEFDFNTRPRRAMLVAQAAHESMLFTSLRESMNYSAEALLRQWPNRFAPADAQSYGRTPLHSANQPMIANLAYGGRLGNGDAASGDGWTFRGAGPIQITGRDMFARCGAALGIDLVADPEQLATDVLAGARSAAWLIAVEKALLRFADRGDVAMCTKYINGGAIGLASRVKLFERAKGAGL